MQTENYFQSRMEVLSLKERGAGFKGSPRRYSLYSFPGHFRQMAENVAQWLGFIYDGLTAARYFTTANEIRSTGRGQSVLVLGGGPSLEALDYPVLQEFQRSGGSVIVCNYFSEVEKFTSIVPDFWILSDPFHEEEPEFPKLLRRIRWQNIHLLVPENHYGFWTRHVSDSRVSTFCDRQVRTLFGRSPELRPDRPRNYSSMTLFKALAIASWIDFDKIFVLGLDNTYPHDIFTDERNELWQVLVHAYGKTTRVSRSSEYQGIADYLFEHAQLFRDLEFFPRNKVVNLDSHSLTDAFIKRQPPDVGKITLESFWPPK